MVQVIEQVPDIFGRLGKGLAEGLQDLPSIIKRRRMASTLEGFGDQKETDPIKMASQLLRSGAETGEMASLIPLIRQFQQIQRFGSKGETQSKQPILGGQPPKTEGVVEPEGSPAMERVLKPETPSSKREGFASPEDIQKFKSKILQPPSFKDRTELAKQYVNMGFSVPEALEIAEKEAKENFSAQKERLTIFEKGLSERIGLELQNQGIGDYKDLQGKIQQQLIDQGKYLVVDRGMTPEMAQEKIADVARDIGLAATQLKRTSSMSMFTHGSKDKIAAVKAQRDMFKQYGMGFEEIYDDLASAFLGTTPMYTASKLDPIQNKDLEDIVKKTKPKIIETLKPFPSRGMRVKQQNMRNIVKKISKDDNLLSLQDLLKEKGISLNQFSDTIQEMSKKKEIELTPLQRRQIQKASSNVSTLGDIWFKAWGG